MDMHSTHPMLQLLTFRLADETFAVDVVKTREVLDVAAVTRVPQSPSYMLGVINLRGSVVPVIDLRSRFGMPASERSRDNCIVVLDVVLGEEKITVGALADSVQEVAEIRPEQIEPPPRLGTGLKTEFIRGMIGKDGEFTILLNIDRIFSGEDLLATQGEKPVC